MKKELEIFVDTIIGENAVELKQFNYTCNNCGKKSEITIPIKSPGCHVDEYVKYLLKVQREEIRKLNKKSTNNKETKIRAGKIINMVIESLIVSGRTQQEAESILIGLIKEQKK